MTEGNGSAQDWDAYPPGGYAPPAGHGPDYGRPAHVPPAAYGSPAYGPFPGYGAPPAYGPPPGYGPPIGWAPAPPARPAHRRARGSAGLAVRAAPAGGRHGRGRARVRHRGLTALMSLIILLSVT